MVAKCVMVCCWFFRIYIHRVT